MQKNKSKSKICLRAVLVVNSCEQPRGKAGSMELESTWPVGAKRRDWASLKLAWLGGVRWCSDLRPSHSNNPTKNREQIFRLWDIHSKMQKAVISGFAKNELYFDNVNCYWFKIIVDHKKYINSWGLSDQLVVDFHFTKRSEAKSV